MSVGLLTALWAAAPARAQTAAPALTVTISPTTVSSGGTALLSWTAPTAKNCSASGGWTASNLGSAGSKSVTNLTKNTMFTVACTNPAGTTSKTTLVLVRVAATPPPPAVTPAPTLTLTANPTTIPVGSFATLKWTATNAQSCAASGGWTASNLAASGSQAVTKVSKNTMFTISCKNSAGSTSRSTLVLVQAATTTTPPVTPSAGAVTRPSYNTGDGFFVLNGRLYDPDGLEFRIRGVDRNHYDSGSEAGIAKSGANAVRMFITTAYGQSWQGLESIAQNQHVNHQQIIIPALPRTSGNVATTCNSNTSALTAAANDWVSSYATWKPLSRYSIINIANEWGPYNSSAWRDAYITAIKQLRAAGYTQPLMVDASGCGQDKSSLLNYADDVFNADPQKNIVFSYHVYGDTNLVNMPVFFSQLQALQRSAGMVFVVGEFGPGRNIGPSPTLLTPGQVITAAETAGIGWLAWAWDDNNLGDCKSNDNWFSMTYSCGQYTQDSDLTLFGKDVVLNPVYGLRALAKKPNW